MTDPTPILSTGHRLVAEMLAGIPEGKTQAFVAEYDAFGRVLRAGYAYRIGEHWKLGAELEYSFGQHPPTGRVVVEWSR